MNDPMIDLLRSEVHRRVASAPPAPTPERIRLAARHQRRLTVAIAVTAVLALGGGVPAVLLQHGSHKAVSPVADPTPSLTPSPFASATPSSPAVSAAPGAGAGSTVSPTPTPLVAPARDCRTNQLKVTDTELSGGLGHHGVAVVFTNTSMHACSLRSYPGVAGLDSAANQVVQARRTQTGYLSGDRTTATVQLAPGGKASAGVEVDDLSKQGQACTRVVALLVTPPGETHSVKVMGYVWCAQPGLQVHPVVAGATGRDYDNGKYSP
jgi:hypothetical protein